MSLEEVLIENVKEHPCLYNKSDKDFKNVYMKAKAWKLISSNTGFSEERLRNRWKTLRNTYRIEEAKRNVPSGSVAKTGRTWRYYHLMRFLKDGSTQHPIIENFEESAGVEIQDMPTENEYVDNKMVADLVLDLSGPASHANESSFSNRRKPAYFAAIQSSYEKFLEKAVESFAAKDEEKGEIFLFMQALATKINNAGLNIDDMGEVQSELLLLVNKKLKGFRNKKQNMR